MTDTNEKADLEQLLASAGWLRFLEHARLQWKESLPDRLINAAELADGAIEVKKVSYAALQINALLSFPKERLAQVSRPAQETVTGFSRGGYETTAPR